MNVGAGRQQQLQVCGVSGQGRLHQGCGPLGVPSRGLGSSELEDGGIIFEAVAKHFGMAHSHKKNFEERDTTFRIHHIFERTVYEIKW